MPPTYIYYYKRYAHSAWPAKWQGFLVLLYAQMVLFLVDEMKVNGDRGHSWDAWTLLKHIKFLVVLGAYFEGFGINF